MILLCILVLAAGALAASSFIVAKQPNAKDALAKLVPAQGIIGIIALIWGVYILFADIVAHMSLYFQLVPFFTIVYLVMTLCAIALGFILGFALIAKYTMKGSPEAQAKGENLRLKLVKFQTPLGLLAIVTAAIALIMRLTGSFG